tara:strand:+ start:1043 stop:1279 length:237 start_codon:yes stop_codon:yes gene_type:complete
MTGQPEDLLRRSFRLAGHRTSLSLERLFWDTLKAYASADGRSMTAIIADIDASRTTALSRAVRIYLMTRALNDGRPRA